MKKIVFVGAAAAGQKNNVIVASRKIAEPQPTSVIALEHNCSKLLQRPFQMLLLFFDFRRFGIIHAFTNIHTYTHIHIVVHTYTQNNPY